jgi:predicted dehydrogenase
VISTGTERTRVELSRKSLIGKARERPDLVREVIARARREGIRATRQAVESKLTEEAPVGYSSAGRIIEVGEHVRRLNVGDAVACAGGGHANHAEIISVPSNLCARVPEGVPLEVAALSTIASIALHGIRLAAVELGDRVAVIGCGLVGQIALRLLRSAGAWTVAVDLDRHRVHDAVHGGADHGFAVGDRTLEELVAETGGTGVDSVLVTAASSNPDPLITAARIARDRGIVVLVGAVPIELPREPLYDKELSLRVSRSYGPGRYDAEYEERGLDYPIGYVRWTEQRNMEAILDLQARGLLRLEDLIDEIVPVADAARAYERLVGNGCPPLRGAIALSYSDGNAARSGAESAPETVPLRLEERPGKDLRKAALASAPQVGLIGPGGFASRTIIPALQAAGATLNVVGGGSGPSAASAARSHTFKRAADTEDEVVFDGSVDTVVVCTRHGSHAQLTARALRAGKHVFTEKPLALTLEELQEVLEAEAASPGILAVGFNRRFSPLMAQMRHFVESSAPVTMTYRVSAGALPADHWVHDPVQGGGRLLGEGCHFVDALAFLAAAPVVRVYATGYGNPLAPLQAHDNVLVTLTFATGSVGSIVYAADGSSKVAKERCEVFCDRRTAILDDFVRLDLYTSDRHEQKTLRSQDKGHRAEIDAFIRGTQTGQPPVPATEIANVSLATLAAVESLRTGKPVRLD